VGLKKGLRNFRKVRIATVLGIRPAGQGKRKSGVRVSLEGSKKPLREDASTSETLTRPLEREKQMLRPEKKGRIRHLVRKGSPPGIGAKVTKGRIDRREYKRDFRKAASKGP